MGRAGRVHGKGPMGPGISVSYVRSPARELMIRWVHREDGTSTVRFDICGTDLLAATAVRAPYIFPVPPVSIKERKKPTEKVGNIVSLEFSFFLLFSLFLSSQPLFCNPFPSGFQHPRLLVLVSVGFASSDPRGTKNMP